MLISFINVNFVLLIANREYALDSTVHKQLIVSVFHIITLCVPGCKLRFGTQGGCLLLHGLYIRSMLENE